MVTDTFKKRLIRDLSRFDTVWGTWSGKLCEIFTDEQKQVIIEFLEKYSALIPMVSELDAESMTSSDREIFELRKSNRDLLIKQATEYWKACV